MIRATDIHSLTDFTRNAKTYVNHITSTRNPMAITVNGDAQVVVQDAESYQAMVDELEHTRFISAIHEGLSAAANGDVQDLDEAFDEINANLGL